MPPLALITGAGTGIGRALSDLLISKGVEILAIGRRRQPLEALAKRYPGRVETLPLDVSDAAAPERIVETVGNRSVAFVVHNAAILEPTGPLAEIDRDAFRRHWETNVCGPLFLTRALLPRLGPGARILHISSGAAHRALAGWGPYCISKSALNMLYQCWREELRDRGILVGSARPGVVDTPMQESIRELSMETFPDVEKFRRLKAEAALTQPEEVARFLAWLLLEADDDMFGTHENDIRDPVLAPHWRVR